MDKPWLLGIDLGGSGARCTLVNPLSTQQFSTCGDWEFEAAPDTFGTGYDIDLSLVWKVVGRTCREVLHVAGIDPAAVAATAVCAMRFSTVILDARGDALLAVDNRDARAVGEYFDIAEQLGPRLLQETGSWPLPLHASARLSWLRNQQPQTFGHAATVFGVGEWLNYRLTGVRAIDPTQASASGLFHLHQMQWCRDIIDELRLPLGIFPPVLAAGSALGTLSPDSAAHLGLHPGTMVALGGADTQCSLLGSGATAPGTVAVVAGTTAPVQAVLAQPVLDVAGAALGSHHITPGHWVLESNGGGMGYSLTLMARMLFPQAPEPELRLLAEAAQSEPGAAGLLSTLGGEVMSMRAPAVPMGHISLSHLAARGDAAPRRHLARALAEGCACGVRANLEQLERILATAATRCDSAAITLCGGLSRSDVFAQLLADITGREVAVPHARQTAALGAAICAAVASGLSGDFASACQRLCGAHRRFEPQRAFAAVNEQLYQSWSQFRQQAETATVPTAVEHLLPRVLRDPEPAPTAIAEAPACRLRALVSASFDTASLQRLGDCIDVEYASFRDVKRLLTGPDLVRALQGKQVFITEVDVVDTEVLRQLPELRVVAACRGDAVNVDVPACTAFGVPVLYAPGRNAIAVADLSVAFMLALLRKLPAATAFLQQPQCTAGNMGAMGQAFSQLQGRELQGKTIGLVGLGAVGRAVAQRLQGFEASVLVADPFATPEQAALAGCRLTDLETLLQVSDIVSLHAAVTDDTRGMFAAEQFASMKPGALFINTARAALIDEQALVDALDSGRLGGAALDAFALEPPGSGHPLVQHPAVITTPHVAGNTAEVAVHQGNSITDALLQLLRGEVPHNVLNPQALARFDWNRARPAPDAHTLAMLGQRSAPAVTDLQRDASAAPSPAADGHTAATPGAADVPAEIAANMRRILQRFCAGMTADPALTAFSADREVTLHFTAHDLDLQFYLSLQRGRVVSALGSPDTAAEVQLQMRGEILDGMFNGSVDAMECAMNGELSFIGDAAKAMTLQHMQSDMERVYRAARAQAGDPGDWSSVIPAGQAAATSADPDAPDIRREMVCVMEELYQSGVITATGGNISVRVPGSAEELWITPSRLFKGDLSPAVMVRINLSGESLDSGARSPSSEWCMHTRILQARTQANAVIHAHAPNATILANCGLPFLPVSTEAAFFDDIPRVPFLMPGTPELADAVVAAMGDEWAVLMVNHGIVVAGRSLRRAADMIEIIERTAEILLGCRAVGVEPPVLPADAVAYFRRIGDIVA
ncbi:MAG: class II aldolase/adducin family protein [Halioglobus sp.]|nr:class II aldolase/adducin family protein [Halioglobus sp.]